MCQHRGKLLCVTDSTYKMFQRATGRLPGNVTLEKYRYSRRANAVYRVDQPDTSSRVREDGAWQRAFCSCIG